MPDAGGLSRRATARRRRGRGWRRRGSRSPISPPAVQALAENGVPARASGGMAIVDASTAMGRSSPSFRPPLCDPLKPPITARPRIVAPLRKARDLGDVRGRIRVRGRRARMAGGISGHAFQRKISQGAYRPEVDGLRFFAIAFVIFGHSLERAAASSRAIAIRSATPRSKRTFSWRRSASTCSSPSAASSSPTRRSRRTRIRSAAAFSRPISAGASCASSRPTSSCSSQPGRSSA